MDQEPFPTLHHAIIPINKPSIFEMGYTNIIKYIQSISGDILSVVICFLIGRTALHCSDGSPLAAGPDAIHGHTIDLSQELGLVVVPESRD